MAIANVENLKMVFVWYERGCPVFKIDGQQTLVKKEKNGSYSKLEKGFDEIQEKAKNFLENLYENIF